MASAATHSQALPTDPVDVADVSVEAIAALVAEGARVVAAGVGPDGETDNAVAGVDAHALLLGLTHDIRSPLGSMLVLVERLRSGRSGPVTPLQERQLGMVYSAAFGLSTFADDVLALARGTTQMIGVDPIPMSINETFRSVRALVQPIAEEKGLTLRCSAPREEQRLGHPAALHRVLLNLVTNALKFTNTGTVIITAHGRGESLMEFEVSDSGIGIPAPLRERFRSGAFEASGEMTSAGLGLSLCAQLLRQMRGTLRYSDRTPCGSTFSFDLSLPRA